MQQTLYTLDPKLLQKGVKPAPRGTFTTTSDVLGSSLLAFDGDDVVYGKMSPIVRDYFEMFRELIYVGASTDTTANSMLGRVYVVLEGRGFIQRGEEITVLVPGTIAVVKPKQEFRLYTDTSYLLLSVIQEIYYNQDLELVKATGARGGRPGSPFASPKRYRSKAVEQLQAMIGEPAAQEPTPATPVEPVDFDPLDPAQHGVNPKPYVP